MNTNKLDDKHWDSLNDLFWTLNLLGIKGGSKAWTELTGYEVDSWK